MSPQPVAPTGRYQSQLLNFLNRQGQRLRDHSAIFLRQLKLTTLWSGQIAFYPVYAIFQATRLAAHQLGTQVQQLLHPQRPVPTVDCWSVGDHRPNHLGQLPPAAQIRLNGITNFDWRSWAQSLSQSWSQLSHPADPHPIHHPFAHWLQAAIHYFFGRSTPTLTAATPQLHSAPQPHIAATQPLPQSAAIPALPPVTDLTWANRFPNDLSPTLIDTTATPIGYIPHPLERVLHWLDQALLWLETQAQRLWQQLQPTDRP
jgi:hypothetical protein